MRTIALRPARRGRRLLSACLLGALFAGAPLARAEFLDVTKEVPLDRLLENVGRWVEAHPDDAHGHYVLARVHAMAFAKGTETLHVVPPTTEGREPGDLPGFAPYESVRVGQGEDPLTEERAAHLAASLRHYVRAASLAPANAKTQLGLAWMLEQGRRHAGRVDCPCLPGGVGPAPSDEEQAAWAALVEDLASDRFETRERAQRRLVAALPGALPFVRAALERHEGEVRVRLAAVLARHWEDHALEAYRRAHRHALEGDREARYFGPTADSAISLEAGQAILRLLGERDPTPEEKAEAEAVGRAIADLERIPRAITPIVFSFEEDRTLADLVDPGRTVAFDLAGDGRGATWPWLRPATAILAWDPEGTGVVASGRQLFGSATWWIAWKDGYEALAALDDDGDGRLRGRELDGLVVWQDGDGDGVSDPGEVQTAHDAGVCEIAVRAAARVDGVPHHPAGIRLEDGTSRPTWDWIAEPAPSPSAASR